MEVVKRRSHRILMIAPQPFYADRGTPMNTLLMCQVLTQAGIRVDLAVLPTGKKVHIQNLRIYCPSKLPGLNSIPIGASLAKLVYDILLSIYALMLATTRRYDAIHGIEEGALIAVILGQLTKASVICDMDSNIPEQIGTIIPFGRNWVQGLVGRMFNWAASRATAIITVCRSLTVYAQSIAPNVPVFQIEDIPLSKHRIFTESDSPPLSEDEIKKLHHLNTKRVVLYTGNLKQYQGIDLLLESWRWLQHNYPVEEAVLVIVGGVSAEIASYGKQCRRMDIEESVVWVGQRPVAEMDAWMKVADILVSPRSQGENTPLKIFSYMASEKVVVATRRPTHTQVISESESFLAEPQPADFGKAMMTALSDPSEACKRAGKAKEKVRQSYNYDVFRSKLLEAYQMVLKINKRSQDVYRRAGQHHG